MSEPTPTPIEEMRAHLIRAARLNGADFPAAHDYADNLIDQVLADAAAATIGNLKQQWPTLLRDMVSRGQVFDWLEEQQKDMEAKRLTDPEKVLPYREDQNALHRLLMAWEAPTDYREGVRKVGLSAIDARQLVGDIIRAGWRRTGNIQPSVHGSDQ